MYRLIVVIFITVSPWIIYSQQFGRIKHFNTSNSLIQSNTIFCIEVDSSNNKWIGTDKGLAKYDGMTWTIFNIGNGLLSNKVTSIAFDKNNNVWIIDSVLSKYDGKIWKHYYEQNNLGEPVNSKHLIIDSIGIKWFVKDNYKLVSFNDIVFTTHLTTPSFIKTIGCFGNQIWIADILQVYKYSNGELTDCSYDKNTNKKIILNIDDMKIDAKGNKWILGNYYLTVGNDSWTYELHLFQLKGDNDYSEIKLPVKDTYGLNIDFENETKWIGVLHYGLVKLTNTNCYLYNHTNDSLLTNVVGIIAVDKKRNKWISATSDWHNMGVSVFNENGVILTSLKNEDNLPSLYSLEQNYPNPFNPFTKISFTIPKFSHVTLKVFDVLGKEISTLVDKGYIAGKYEVEFHGNNLSSGIYFYTLRTDDYKETKKLLLIK